MADNVGVGVGISTISHSRPEIQVLPVSKWLFPFPEVGERQVMSTPVPFSRAWSTMWG